MTRKDYQLIANAVKKVRDGYEHIPTAELAINSVAHELARALRVTNNHFDSDKFLAACGLAVEDINQ
jgi:hypothetical protein